MQPKYKRILLKLSGESLAGEAKHGIDFDTVVKICEPIKKCVDEGVQVGIVVGGGNFWRGRSSGDMDRTRADHMGMLATTINALGVADALEQLGVEVRVQTAITMRQVAEPYIRNKAMRAIVLKVYEAIHNATGVKYAFENASLTKAGVDGVLTKIRRFGRPTVIGDYAILSQFTPWAGYVGSINSNTITGISEAQMNEIAQNGLLGMYNGAVLAEIENPYDETTLNATGDDFETMLPAGLGFIVPTGAKSPIATYTRGGLTSFTGNNVKNGKIESRFDISVGCDVAKGQEYKIGMFLDSNISSL